MSLCTNGVMGSRYSLTIIITLWSVMGKQLAFSP